MKKKKLFSEKTLCLSHIACFCFPLPPLCKDDDYYRNERGGGDFQRGPNRSRHPRSHRRDRFDSDDRYYDSSEEYYGPPRDRPPRDRPPFRGDRPPYRGEDSRRRLDDRRRSKSPSRSRNKEKEEKVLEWPPCFETHGNEFVFDTRSAMFYESQSNFFYDPKSKLYYGNSKKAYFRYDDTLDPPFKEIEKTPEILDDEMTKATKQGGEGNYVNPKPTIAIKLKSKKLKKPKNAAAVQDRKAPPPPVAVATPPSSAPVVSKIEKERIANIEKWNETQAQLKAESLPKKKGSNSSSSSSSAANNVVVVASSQKIRTTAKGEPICVVCKRKFPTIDKLRIHERMSELHKTNLAKLAAANKSTTTNANSENSAVVVAGAVVAVATTTTTTTIKRKDPPATLSTEYTDRAQKRRDLHGSGGGGPDAPIKPFQNDEEVSHDPPILSSDSLGESNIGNQMLKKMGWDAHQAERSVVGVQNDIRKDWERIETLASRPKH